jgi:hypothetical protein
MEPLTPAVPAVAVLIMMDPLEVVVLEPLVIVTAPPRAGAAAAV